VVPVGPVDGGNQGGEDPAQSGANLGLIGGAIAGGVALIALVIAFFLLKRRGKDLDGVESEQAEVDVDTFHTEQFDGEDEIAGDYTNPVYDGKESDDLGDQFEDDAGEIL
jgi:hypothetical protein